jgi:hypothetical protein
MVDLADSSLPYAPYATDKLLSFRRLSAPGIWSLFWAIWRAEGLRRVNLANARRHLTTWARTYADRCVDESFSKR